MTANSCHVSRGIRLSELTLAGTLETVPDEWDDNPVGGLVRQRTGSDEEAKHLEFFLNLHKPEHHESVRYGIEAWDRHRKRENAKSREHPIRYVPMSQRFGSETRFERLLAPLDDVTQWMLQQSSTTQCDWWEKLEAEEDGEDRRRKRGIELSYDPNWRVFGKVRNSRWRWGCGDTWNLSAKIFNALPKFEITHPRVKFDHFLTWTVGSNERGSSVHQRWMIDRDASTYVWLDGSMGFCLWVDDVWVATIGFAPMACGLGILQIQFKAMGRPIRRKVLDGWDYKTAVIDAFKKAFEGIPLFMATGASLHAWIVKSYTYSLSEELHFAENDRKWERSEEWIANRQSTIAKLREKIESLKDPHLVERMRTRYAEVPQGVQLWNSNGIEFVPI